MTDPGPTRVPPGIATRARILDADDDLASHRGAFVDGDSVKAYLDGNSLGRPLVQTADRLASFVGHSWGSRLIRSWDEGWMEMPTEVGDRLGRIVLGAESGQTVVADSTTVLLYKLIRAGAEAARADGRNEIIVDVDNFPTDRFVAQAIAAEQDLVLRWIEPGRNCGVTADQIREIAGPRTGLVVLSHVAYRSGYLADMADITSAAHDAGALVLWDLCHSAGAVELSLDALGVDLAVGCTYKYLNGGPGSPAFAYVARSLQDHLNQPIVGWMGAADPFAMGSRHLPAQGMRRFLSGTPPILGMLPMCDMLDLVETAGISAIRKKSIQLTQFAIELTDELLAPLGAELASPREADRRGSHITVEHPAFASVVAELWRRGVLPDFRPPSGLRIGLSPLSTSFSEVAYGLAAVAQVLAVQAA